MDGTDWAALVFEKNGDGWGKNSVRWINFDKQR